MLRSITNVYVNTAFLPYNNYYAVLHILRNSSVGKAGRIGYMNKTVKRVWNWVTSVLVAAVVILAILLVGARVVGLQVYTVLSGSMEPTYHTGALLYVKEIDPEELRVGDPATFILDEDLTVATHRVIEIDEENQCFYTKGDANDTADAAPVYYENLLGRPVFSIPYLGYVAVFIQNPPGTYIAFAAGMVILLLVFLPDLLGKDPEKRSRRKCQEK